MQTARSPQALYERYAQHHDLDALGQLFDDLAPKLLPIARRLTRDEHDAADALQETFLALVERRGRFDRNRELVPWVVGILINKTRSASRRREFQVTSADGSSLKERHGSTPLSEAPEEKLARFELGHALKSALDTLPPALRTAVTERLFQGEAGPSVAAAEGISQGALRVRLFRGRELLQRALGPVAATWFGSLLLTSLGLPSTQRTLAQLKRRTLQEAAGTTAKSATAAASRLAPKLLATAAVGAAALTVALNFMGDSSPQSGAVSVKTAQVETAPNAASAPAAAPDRTPEASIAPKAARAGLTTFTARVLTLDGAQPLEGQVVQLTTGTSSNPTSHEASTDSEGRATFDLSPGSTLRNIRALPSATTTSNLVWINRLPEGTDAIDLFVGLGASLSGTVLGPDKQPVPFAEVRVWCSDRFTTAEPDRTTQANAAGQFTIQHIGPKVILTARAEGLACSQGLRGTLVEGRAEAGAKLYLDEAVTRTGFVLNPAGVPVEGANVIFRDGLMRSSSRDLTSISGITQFQAGSGQTETGPDGHFAVPDLPISSTYCNASAFPFKKVTAHFQEGPEVPLTIHLAEAQFLAGQVVDERGRPLEGVHVEAWPFGGGASHGYEAKSDEHGAFRLEGLTFQEGPFTSPPAVTARLAGYSAHFQQPVEPNDSGLIIQMQPERILRGHIATSDLETTANLELWLLSDHIVERAWTSPIPSTLEGQTGTYETQTDTNGNFEFTELSPGPLRLFIKHPTAPLVEAEFAVGAAQEQLDITLGEKDFPRVIFEGTITDGATCKPLVGAFVSADWQRTQVPGGNELGHFSLIAVSDAEGHFATDSIPAGPIKLLVSKDGYTSFSLDLGVLDAGHETRQITLTPERSLHVLLRDQDTSLGREGSLLLTDAQGEPVMIQSGNTMSSTSISSMGAEAFLHGLPAKPLLLTVTSSGTKVTVPVDMTQPNDVPLLVYLPTPAPPEPQNQTVDVSWLFLELTSPFTPEEAALFDAPIDQAALRPWFIEQQESGRIDTPQHAFRVTVEDAKGEVFNSTSVTPTLHGEAPPTYTIEREGRTITRHITATIEHDIEMTPVPSHSTISTSTRTINDAHAAYVNAHPPVGRIRLRVTSENYEPLDINLDIESGHKPGIGDAIFLVPK